jgi:hypothetical protein
VALRVRDETDEESSVNCSSSSLFRGFPSVIERIPSDTGEKERMEMNERNGEGRKSESDVRKR